MNKNDENDKTEKEFENIEKFQPITESNKQLINMIEKRNDEMVEDIINTLPYHKDNKQEELLPITDDRCTEKEPEESTLNILNNFSKNRKEF